MGTVATIDLVKNAIGKNISPKQQDTHEKELRAFLELENLPIMVHSDLIRTLAKKAELPEYIVNADIITRFKYHAVIKATRWNVVYLEDRKKDHNTGGEIKFRGDIPEFALQRATKLWSVFFENSRLMVNCITIHSNAPLPSYIDMSHVRDRELPKVDPVMIAWTQNPNIALHRRTRKLLKYEKNAYGLVIAVWDNDKELEL